MQNTKEWIIIKDNKYYYGESLTYTIVPIYGNEMSKARIYRNKDFADMVAKKYGGRVVLTSNKTAMPAEAIA